MGLGGFRQCLSDLKLSGHCLNALNMPKCVILKVHLKIILKRKEKPKSKLGLLRVIMGFDKYLNQSLQGSLKKISSMSSNGLPRNYCGALEVNLKTCAKGTKLKVYIISSTF